MFTAGALQRMTSRLGSDRSAMILRLFGLTGDNRIERRWTLIAERGDGPEIPALAVPPIAALIFSGQESPGARDAGQALSLADFEPAFARLAIAHASEERVLPPSLYARIMGDRFDSLPPAVRRIHNVLRNDGAAGEAEVAGAANALGALIAHIMRFPAAGRHPIHVAFHECDGTERWVRRFGASTFASSLSAANGDLVEWFGPLRFRFDLPSDHRGLEMRIKGWSVFRVPLPLAWAPRALAREWEEDGRFCFDVPIALPLVGRIVHYRGWLRAYPDRSMNDDWFR